jgi:hypothetical protein
LTDPGYNRIFLLSHMRAYTSLLGHILGSHPQINGYYELHLSYTDERNLSQQQQLYAQTEKLKPSSSYLFDKLLHNDYQLNLKLPNLRRGKVLLALRPPAESIPSIVFLFGKKENQHPYANPAKATQYYIARLQNLSEFSEQYPLHYFYFDAPLLHSNSEYILNRLTQWLDLDEPLSERYQCFSQTGQARAGDSSQTIKSGKILHTNHDYSSIKVDKNLIDEAEQVYRQCRVRLIKNALDSVLE